MLSSASESEEFISDTIVVTVDNPDVKKLPFSILVTIINMNVTMNAIARLVFF